MIFSLKKKKKKRQVLGTHWNCFIVASTANTHNIYLYEKKKHKKIFIHSYLEL